MSLKIELSFQAHDALHVSVYIVTLLLWLALHYTYTVPKRGKKNTMFIEAQKKQNKSQILGTYKEYLFL